MKKNLILTIAALLMMASAVTTSAAQAQSRGPRGGDIPPDLKAKLSIEQQTELRAATSMEDRIALLKSWNIEMPARPEGDRRGPPPDGAAADGIQPTDAMLAILKKARQATTDEEREVARNELRTLYKSSTDETEREAIRRFFSRHPSNASNSTTSSSRTQSLAQ